MPINQNQLDGINKSLLEMANLKNKISSDFKAYLENVKHLGVLQQNIKYLEENIGKLTQNTADALAEKKRLQIDLNNAVASGTQQQKDAAKVAFNAGKAAHKAAQSVEKDNLKKLESLREELELNAAITKEANLANLAYAETGKIWNKLPSLAKSFYREIRDLAAVKMSKDIKQAELSMGILGNQSKFFSKGISKASESTIQLGFGISDIAKSQADYSEEIGRSAMLNERGMIAMAEMAKGTTLGVEGASAMAADMERFGVSVEGSRDMIQETVDMAGKMGVNSTKAIKELTKNLKVAQTFHFKGGIRGMVEMANYAAKMKVDMAGISGMADKVFRPEGAVEMAARLQTMGGAFARLGNPFELMFKARNDFGAFTKDVANATAELAQFNESTGEFEIGGLQLDRLREIATITGIGADQLSEMAKSAAKFNRIESLIPSIMEDEDKELVSSLAQMGDDGEYYIHVNGKDLKLDQLNSTLIKNLRDEKSSLAKRAEQAQTFDDAFNNLVNQFKSGLLPFVEELNEYFVPALKDFTKKLIDEGWIDKMKSIAADVGKFVVGVGKIVASIVDTLGIEGTLATILGVTGILNAAKWYATGVQLGMGFNMVARASPTPTPTQTTTQTTTTPITKGGAAMSAAKGAAPFAAIGALFAGYNKYSEEKEKGKSTGEAGGRALFTGIGAGGGMMAGAAAGGAIGAAFGGVGAVPGAMIGMALGSLGMLGGQAVGNSLGDAAFGVDDAVVKFNPQDKVVSMSDGMVASTNKGKIDDLVGGSRGGSVQKIEFGKLEITGTIKLEIPGSLPKEINLANEPEFVRQLSTLIAQQARINSSGGKLSPNMY